MKINQSLKNFNDFIKSLPDGVLEKLLLCHKPDDIDLKYELQMDAWRDQLIDHIQNLRNNN